MKQRLHIHFGIHRTGTTSIHKHLSGNLPVLREMGVCYPEMGVGHRHVKLAWQLLSGKTSPQELLSRLKQEVPADAALVILSSEDFSQIKDTEWLKILADHYDLGASVYLKRQEAWLESWYNQNIRWPWDKRFSSATPEEFLKHIDEYHWIDFRTLLDRIASVVPRERFYVNVIDSAGIRDTVGDLLRYCGIDQARLAPADVANESISAARLEIVRRLDLLKVNPGGRRKILAALARMAVEEDDGSRVVFNDEQVTGVLNKYAESNRAVAREYFGRDELFLDPVKSGRRPVVIADRKAYRVYIPRLLKEMVSP
jgi:hypothetical protein